MPERRTIQILKILKEISDEEHSVTQAELLREMMDTMESTTNNPETLSRSIDEILFQINPFEYSEENDDDYKIKYDGYKQNRIIEKQDIKENISLKIHEAKKRGIVLKKSDARKEVLEELNGTKKLPIITNLSYVHDFNNSQLDIIIQAVCFSDFIPVNDKTKIIRKLVATASKYYKTPYYDKYRNKLLFNPMGIYGRTESRMYENNMVLNNCGELSNNLQLIQEAINRHVQIKFCFNRYDEKGKLVKIDYDYPALSPYYVVVYHDMYYLIGGHKDKQHVSHYRIDLMSDISFLKNSKEQDLTIIPKKQYMEFKNQFWNPEKYMSEHLYMAYDEPRRIKIKIKSEDYTFLHDWFGNHYRKISQECKDGYDIVEINTSATMMVHWAMQYAGKVEIMDEEIRNMLRKEIEIMQKKYEN